MVHKAIMALRVKHKVTGITSGASHQDMLVAQSQNGLGELANKTVNLTASITNPRSPKHI